VPPTAAHHRDELIDRAWRADTVAELFRAASSGLRRVVPFDGAVWLATDPATNLPTAPTRSEKPVHVAGSDDCVRAWRLEFQVEDVNLFRDLTDAGTPAGALRMATRDRPARSARYRELLRPNGIDDELRAVMRVDGSPWAWFVLYRQAGRPAFTALEIEMVASLSAPLAAAVRNHSRAAARTRAENRGPGLMLFSPGGELLSVNDDALAWLEEIAWLDEVPAGFEAEPAFQVRLPMAVSGTLVRARAIARQHGHQSARTRIRSGAGRWLVCHASCLREASGKIGSTALVIEPATSSEIAPIIVQAYELSIRERQIAQLISQGAATAEIATRLHLSAHTVRDYIKAIFEKVGVSSRGELVATLFAETYAPVHVGPER
jgi:DNA-binding CsgD family transcriptional regulator